MMYDVENELYILIHETLSLLIATVLALIIIIILYKGFKSIPHDVLTERKKMDIEHVQKKKQHKYNMKLLKYEYKEAKHEQRQK